MGMKEWAEREVQIACKRENPDRKEGEFDYGCACYESALKAFNSLMEDGHSGMSIGFTKQILNRLIDGKPLTPIEDTDDTWTYLADVKDDGFKHYQCNRMYSLFKHVYPDGTVKYSDADRVICIDVETENAYSFGLVRDIIDEMFPIKMPYSAATKYKVYCSDFLYDSKNGDFDTVAVHYVETSDGNRIGIHKYFRPANEDEPEFPNWKEINVVDYVERKEECDKKGRQCQMKNNVTSDVLLVGLDFSKGENVGVLIVGRKRPNNSFEIINTFQGEEARWMYNRLITKDKDEGEVNV